VKRRKKRRKMSLFDTNAFNTYVVYLHQILYVTPNWVLACVNSGSPLHFPIPP
jgi:hypothetical protein